MSKFVATAIALCIGTASLAVHAQNTGGKKQFDPYSQGAKAGDKFDPYSQGAKAGDKFDPYTQGTNQSTRADLAPGQDEGKKTGHNTAKKSKPAKPAN